MIRASIVLTFVISFVFPRTLRADDWISLLPPKNLSGWKRIPLGPTKKLSAKNPWQVDAKTKTLICDGDGFWEMLLLQNKTFRDGTFHVEWRFRKVPGKKIGYNGGVYVRTSADGKHWLQAQVGVLDKAPNVADLFGDLPVNGETKRIVQPGTGHKHAKPPGQWNTYDIVCQGSTIKVKLNGKTVTVMKNCPRLSGHIGLQSEHYYLEFRNLKWKAGTAK